MIAANEKKYKKVKEKFGNKKKPPYLCKRNSKENNMKTVTLRIYKDEIDATRLAYIRKHFALFMESPKVLTVQGDSEEMEKLYSCYLLDENRFKAVFPDFLTYAERVRYTEKLLAGIKNYYRDVLCEIIANGEITPEFQRLREIYLNELK